MTIAELETLLDGIVWPDHIEVKRSKSKTRSRRLIPITPNLLQWLEPHRKASGPICNDIAWNYWKRLARLAKHLGIQWKKNGLRRAYATYLYAQEENEQIVAARTGHSPTMLFADYRGLTSKKSATEWFSITPKTVADL